MTAARLREIAAMLPGYVCGQIEAHADAWERDLADAREAREEAAKMQRWAEEAAAAENANARDLRAALNELDRVRSAEAHHETPHAATSGCR